MAPYKYTDIETELAAPANLNWAAIKNPVHKTRSFIQS